MTDRRRIVVHEIKLSLGTKLLLAGAVAGLLLNALVPLLRVDPAHAQSFPDKITMNCTGQGTSVLSVLSLNLDCSGKLR
jgi:hypothetical protein